MFKASISITLAGLLLLSRAYASPIAGDRSLTGAIGMLQKRNCAGDVPVGVTYVARVSIARSKMYAVAARPVICEDADFIVKRLCRLEARRSSNAAIAADHCLPVMDTIGS